MCLYGMLITWFSFIWDINIWLLLRSLCLNSISTIVGMQELYEGLHSLSCYKRRYGVSAFVISQFVLHDAGTNSKIYMNYSPNRFCCLQLKNYFCHKCSLAEIYTHQLLRESFQSKFAYGFFSFSPSQPRAGSVNML